MNHKIYNRLAILAFSLLGVSAASGCAVKPAAPDRPVVDAMFRPTGEGGAKVITIASPGLVNELNGAFKVRDAGYYTRSALNVGGERIEGLNSVFALEFTDHGAISILRSDDCDVSLRAELGPLGKVERALLGSSRGTVEDGFTSFENDEFVSGTYEVLYDGPSIVVGRIDLKFRKYRVKVNFRLLRR